MFNSNVKMHVTECGDYKRFATDSRDDGLQTLQDIMGYLYNKEQLEQDADLDARDNGYVRRQFKQDFVIVGGNCDYGHFWVIDDPCDYIDVVRHSYPLCNMTLGDEPKDSVPSKVIILNPHIAEDKLVIWTEWDDFERDWVVYNLDVSNNELPEVIRQLQQIIYDD